MYVIFNDVLGGQKMKKINKINGLHPKLKFTLEVLKNNDEKEDEVGRIAFLDMEIIQKWDGSLESEWYRKPTDTGIVMNWYSIAPLRYKKNIV